MLRDDEGPGKDFAAFSRDVVSKRTLVFRSEVDVPVEEII
jgi:hypothetical protein